MGSTYGPQFLYSHTGSGVLPPDGGGVDDQLAVAAHVELGAQRAQALARGELALGFGRQAGAVLQDLRDTLESRRTEVFYLVIRFEF